MWDYITRAIHNRINVLQTADGLVVAAVEEWCNTLQDTINRLIISMDRRVNMLFQHGGGHTEY